MYDPKQQSYTKAEYDDLKQQLTAANEEISFWMGEGDGTEWPPENAEWRKLFNCKKRPRPSEQIKKMQQLATIIRWKSDEQIQYKRAELAEQKLAAAEKREEGLRQFKDIATEMYPMRMGIVSGACDFANEQALGDQKPPDDTEKNLRDALQALYDEQNGPPLFRDEKTWQAAMDRAEELFGD